MTDTDGGNSAPAPGAPHGVILAGGSARRMGGRDKALLPLDARTLLEHVAARLAPAVAALALSANGDLARFEGHGLPVLADADGGGSGPLAGVLAGLDWAAGNDAAAIVTAAADTPFFPADLVARLTAAAPGGGIVLAATRDPDGVVRRHGTFGLWPVALREDLRAALRGGTRKLTDWADAHGARMAVWDGTGEPFFNVNAPGDLARARARAGGAW